MEQDEIPARRVTDKRKESLKSPAQHAHHPAAAHPLALITIGPLRDAGRRYCEQADQESGQRDALCLFMIRAPQRAYGRLLIG